MFDPWKYLSPFYVFCLIVSHVKQCDVESGKNFIIFSVMSGALPIVPKHRTQTLEKCKNYHKYQRPN